MKPAPFRYHRPASKADALDLLANCENAKVLAGGQSLMPMLNMRYVLVDDVIDINGIGSLTGIEVKGDTLRIGAMTRQRDILNNGQLSERAPIFAQALRYVGHIQTRNRGTIGGSLAHMDPAAELVGLARLFDAKVTVESKDRGARAIAMEEFPQYYMTPDIKSDELLTEITFKLPTVNHGFGFQEFAQRHGDFAIAGTAVILEPTDDGSIATASAVLIGNGVSAIRLPDVETVLIGSQATDDAIKSAGQKVNEMDISGDALISAAYRKRLARVMTERALRQARDTMNGGNR